MKSVVDVLAARWVDAEDRQPSKVSPPNGVVGCDPPIAGRETGHDLVRERIAGDVMLMQHHRCLDALLADGTQRSDVVAPRVWRIHRPAVHGHQHSFVLEQ
eukprot:scaffold3581_cov252-Pinguiococcus_pyrenoidosus.AAC.6